MMFGSLLHGWGLRESWGLGWFEGVGFRGSEVLFFCCFFVVFVVYIISFASFFSFPFLLIIVWVGGNARDNGSGGRTWQDGRRRVGRAGI